MKCPDCQKPLFEHDTPGPSGEAILIDRCTAEPSCGTWYDRGEYAAIDPRLSHAKARDALVNSVRAAPGATDRERACPRCAERSARDLVPVRFVGVGLHLCTGCSGVWAPRGAVTAVINALSLHDSKDGGMLNEHYRSAAAAPVMRDNGAVRTACCACGQRVRLEDSVLSEKGLACVLCAAASEQGEDSAASQSLWSFMRGVLRDLGMK